MLDQGSGVESGVVVPDGATVEPTANGVSNGQRTESTHTSELEREPVQESVLLECRLILGLVDPQYLDPSTELPTLHDGSELGTFDERDYTRAHERSVAERANHWREQREDAAMEAWKASFVRDVTNPVNADHIERLQWLQDTIGIDFDAFTPDSAARVHAHYFSNASGTETGEEAAGSEADTPEKKFARDVLAAYRNDDGINMEALRRDIESIQWFAEIFGEQSSKAITQYILGEANIITDRASFAAEIQAAAGSPLSEDNIAILSFIRGEEEDEDTARGVDPAHADSEDRADELMAESANPARADEDDEAGTAGLSPEVSDDKEDELALVEVDDDRPEEDGADSLAETDEEDGQAEVNREENGAPQARVPEPPPVVPAREPDTPEPEPPAAQPSADELNPPDATPNGAAESTPSAGADEHEAPESDDATDAEPDADPGADEQEAPEPGDAADDAEPGTTYQPATAQEQQRAPGPAPTPESAPHSSTTNSEPTSAASAAEPAHDSGSTPAQSPEAAASLDRRAFELYKSTFERMMLPDNAIAHLSNNAANYHVEPERLSDDYAPDAASRFRLVSPEFNGRLVQLNERDTFLQTYEHNNRRFIRFAAGRKDGVSPFTIRSVYLRGEYDFTSRNINDQRGVPLPNDFADNVFFITNIADGPEIYMKLDETGNNFILADRDDINRVRKAYAKEHERKNAQRLNHASGTNASVKPTRVEAAPPAETAAEAGVETAVAPETDVELGEAEAVAPEAGTGSDVEASVEGKLVTEDPTEVEAGIAEGRDGVEADELGESGSDGDNGADSELTGADRVEASNAGADGDTAEDDIPSDLRLSGNAARALDKLDEDLGDTMGRQRRRRRNGEPDSDDEGNGRGRRRR